MPSKPFKLSSAFILALSLSILFAACDKKTGSQEQGPSIPVTEAGGGIDGSGGDALQSTVEEVQSAFSNVLGGLEEKLTLMKRNLKSDYFAYEYQYGNASHALISSFINADATADKTEGPDIYESIKAGKIEIEGILTDCKSAQGTRDGSAIGDLEKGNICVSLSRLRKIPPAALEDQIFSLIIHELSHLVGFDERQAVYLQKLVSLHPGIYSKDNRDPYSPKKLPTCDGYNFGPYSKSTYNQDDYWIRAMDRIKASLSGNIKSCERYSSGQSKMSIYTDDIEWFELTTKFSISYEGANRSTPGIRFGMKEMAGFTNSLTLHISDGAGGEITLQAHVGTDAQCNPKAFLANVLANLDEVWTLRCDDNQDKINLPEKVQSRIAREKKILENDPENKKAEN